ncbi:MAG: 5-deoxy-glucuronate isomerase [Pseudomonadota bacterium]
MQELQRRPSGARGCVHAISPQNAGWTYVGFDLHRLLPGDRAEAQTLNREVILVLVEGRAELSVDGRSYGECGERLSVFEQLPPHCLYVPSGSSWAVKATTATTLAVCSAPGLGNHPPRLLGPDGIETEERGVGRNRRFINNIAMEDRPVADHLLVTEVFTPQGNWSSYPAHRHDEDDFPRITYLEETYYHRLNPPQGFGVQRVYTEDGSLDQTMSVQNHDVVLVPRGHHPCGAVYGYEMYYLNVMAGPLRKWRFQYDQAHAWLAERDSKT